MLASKFTPLAPELQAHIFLSAIFLSVISSARRHDMPPSKRTKGAVGRGPCGELACLELVEGSNRPAEPPDKPPVIKPEADAVASRPPHHADTQILWAGFPTPRAQQEQKRGLAKPAHKETGAKGSQHGCARYDGGSMGIKGKGSTPEYQGGVLVDNKLSFGAWAMEKDPRWRAVCRQTSLPPHPLSRAKLRHESGLDITVRRVKMDA